MNKNNKHTTPFGKINGMRFNSRIDVAKTLDRRVDSKSQIHSFPTMKKGSINSQIISYLRTRKNPVSIVQIIEHIAIKRDYKNYNSAYSSIANKLLQLSNWNMVKVTEEGCHARFSRI